MIKNKLGNTGETVSRLGFGTMRLPMTADKKINREEAFEMIDLAYKSGINYYDTAYLYHYGESETFLGEALSKYPRDTYYLADKLPSFKLKSDEDPELLLAEQLKRCNVDYFDFYLLHTLNEANWALCEKYHAIDTLLKKQKEGKFKHFGFSFHGDFDTFIKVLDAHEWDFVQLQFNYVDYVKIDAKKFYEELNKRGIPMIVMEPLRGGFLASLPEPALDAFGEKDVTKSTELAFRWLITMENTPLILSGMSDINQVKQNVKIFENPKPMSGEELGMADVARERILAIKTISCTACGYCAVCPSDVDIPANFASYNDYMVYNNKFNFAGEYDGLGGKSAKNCISCGACSPLCPQGLDIPELLATVVNARESVVF